MEGDDAGAESEAVEASSKHGAAMTMMLTERKKRNMQQQGPIEHLELIKNFYNSAASHSSAFAKPTGAQHCSSAPPAEME
jgi:sulfopyruvate decarboxylase TPP-binding subunit